MDAPPTRGSRELLAIAAFRPLWHSAAATLFTTRHPASSVSISPKMELQNASPNGACYSR